MVASDDIVGETMRRHPHTIRVFLDFRFACVGCPIASMHSVADATHEHGAELNAFLTALNAAAPDGATEPGSQASAETSVPEQSDF